MTHIVRAPNGKYYNKNNIVRVSNIKFESGTGLYSFSITSDLKSDKLHPVSCCEYEARDMTEAQQYFHRFIDELNE